MVSKKFLATCWVIVEAPSNLFDLIILDIFFIIALKTPLASTPGCVKKFLSSADKKEFTTFGGIDSLGTKILFSLEKSATNVPSPE